MPIHDWSRVSTGTFHDFHVAWIAEIRNALNGGILPPSFYAMAEQIAGPLGPDVITLQSESADDADPSGNDAGPVALAVPARGCASRLRPTWMNTC